MDMTDEFVAIALTQISLRLRGDNERAARIEGGKLAASLPKNLAWTGTWRYRSKADLEVCAPDFPPFTGGQ
jgi:hypothetical protein